MPNCRNCGSRLSRFDKDMCPICGAKDPFLGMTTETSEITTEIDTVSEIKDYKRKSKKIAMSLSILIGWTGLPFYYLKYIMTGILWMVVNILCLVTIFCAIYFGVHLDLLISILIPVGVIYLANIILGIIIVAKSDFKDGSGEFLK